MKKIFIFVLISFSLKSCNNELTQSEILEFYSKLNDSGFKPQPIYLNQEANPVEFFYALKEQREHYDDLLEKMDILFPLENFPEEERIEADQKYRVFVKSHPDDAFLPIIRSRYSKFILVNFRLLETDNYEQIKFYTNELIEAKSDKYELLIESLKKLKGNIPANEFEQLRASAINSLTEQQADKADQLMRLRKKAEELLKIYKESGKRPTRVSVWALDKNIQELEENAIACTIQKVTTI
ncbi:hypothetical protein [Emticicia agri]|uniref:Uncharacterized protein n=1 Tax=Emticicia agri TaxID=2492393 RepID=A0A4V1ZCS5_9BACT|nr:hypothetical protein [Emticicia agri]RYU93680.1 hypothetical protein EWM59_20810 [Emticicia agri]